MPEQELTIRGYERDEGTRIVDANALVHVAPPAPGASLHPIDL